MFLPCPRHSWTVLFGPTLGHQTLKAAKADCHLLAAWLALTTFGDSQATGDTRNVGYILFGNDEFNFHIMCPLFDYLTTMKTHEF